MKYLGLVVLFFTGMSLMADPSPGIIDEYTQVEGYINDRKPTNEFKKRNLEFNILTAVKSTLAKKINNTKEIKAINMTEIAYEKAKDSHKVYVRYKAFYIYYEFIINPEIYIVSPLDEIVYLKPESFKPVASEADQAPAPAPAKTGEAPK
jgi:hypothetical protein